MVELVSVRKLARLGGGESIGNEKSSNDYFICDSVVRFERPRGVVLGPL